MPHHRQTIRTLAVAVILAGASSIDTRAQGPEVAKPLGTVAELVETAESERLEPGVLFQAYIVKPKNLPRHKIWIYHPDPLPSDAMPLVIVPPAGGNLVSAPKLSPGDRPEHLPYVRAGFAVMSFNIHGTAPEDESGDELAKAAINFRAGKAGLGNARSALDFAVSRLAIDSSRIYAAGHSSAASLVLLFAAMEPRIDAVAAYAPVTDVVNFLGSEFVEIYDEVLPGYRKFMEWSSPATHMAKLTTPIFLFHAKDDSVVAYQETLTFAKALGQVNNRVRFVSAEQGDHYDSMIEAGIPAALKWMQSLANP